MNPLKDSGVDMSQHSHFASQETKVQRGLEFKPRSAWLLCQASCYNARKSLKVIQTQGRYSLYDKDKPRKHCAK